MIRFVLQWHITERCNLKCTHCYQDEQIIKDELSLAEKFEVVDKFVDFVKILNQNHPSRGIINLTGGEPFIDNELEALLNYISKFSDLLSFNFLSNGTLIDTKTSLLLQNYRPSYVQISIDGDENAHDKIRGVGAFSKAIEGIKKLQNDNIQVVISFTAHKQNYKEFPKVVKIAKRLKVHKVWSDRLIPEGRAEEKNLQLLNPQESFKYVKMMKIEQIKNRLNPFSKTIVSAHRALQFIPFLETPHTCTAGKYLFTLLPNGEVLPCRRMPIRVGNIKNTTFTDIYQKNDLIIKLKTSNGNSKGCEKCKFTKTCNGGLKCLSYAITGSPFVKDPGCWRN